MSKNYALIVHSGFHKEPDMKPYHRSIINVLSAGQKMLAKGTAALDVVEHCTMLLEDDELFNAGRGSSLTEAATVEMDAGIMDGRDLKAGAVAAVSGVKNPVHLARAVMEKSKHVMFVGQGANKFAQEHGLELKPLDYFITKKRLQRLEKVKKKTRDLEDKPMGTVGAVAHDIKSNIAAATSTGGNLNTKKGRVGDSAVIGAGVYADNELGGVSCTGHGEDFIRTVLAKKALELIEHKGLSAQEAAEVAIEYLRKKVNGSGGLIVVDAQGRCGGCSTSKNMIYGRVTDQEAPRICPSPRKRSL